MQVDHHPSTDISSRLLFDDDDEKHKTCQDKVELRRFPTYNDDDLLETVQQWLQTKLVSERDDRLIGAYRQLYNNHTNNNNNNTTATKRKPELILISGPNGSGKTHLAKSLQRQQRVLLLDDDEQDGEMTFLLGKFDQFQRPEPYSAFVSAFTEFFTVLMERESPERILKVRNTILEAVGDGASAITDMIPSMKHVMGYDNNNNNNNNKGYHTGSASSSLKNNGVEAMNRFVFVFRMFLKAVSTLEHQFVFVLDDIQWADSCSLDLLASLLVMDDNDNTTTTERQGVVCFVATCEDQNVALDSPLASMLRNLEDDGKVQITNVVTRNLTEEEVLQMVQDVLSHDYSLLCTELVHIIYRQTNGNLYYIMEFIRWLLEERLVEFSHHNQRWEWELDDISMSINQRDQVGNFLLNKMEQLPNNVQHVLKVASCLGTSVNDNMLAMVVDDNNVAVATVKDALDVAVKRGILLLDQNGGGHNTYSFAHDIAQKSVYALIKPEDRSHFHYRIGRRLWLRMNESDVNNYLFKIVSQFCSSSGHVIAEDGDSKAAIAALFLQAGKKAAKSSTFRMASIYLNHGIQLLGPTMSCWKDHYELALELYNAAAEMELCTANFDRMNILLEAIFTHATNRYDTLQASATRIYALGARDQQQQALQEAKLVLRQLGQHFPVRFVKAQLLSELFCVKRLLHGKSDSMLLRLGLMEDRNKLAAIQILDLMFLNALITTPTFFPFVVLKMMKLTLLHGSSAWAATAFSSYGMVCCAMGDYEQAFRFGQLSLAFLEKFKCREFLPRVYFGVYGCIHAWTRPVLEVLEPLRAAHRVGLETGDFESSFLTSHIYCLSAVQAGVPLIPVEKDVSGFCHLMASKRHEATLQLASLFLQTIHHLMGYTKDPLNVVGDVVDVGKAMDHATKTNNSTLKMAILSQRTILAYVFGAFDLADELVNDWRHFRFTNGPDAFVISLMDGLIAAAAARRHKQQRRRQLGILRTNIKDLTRWARKAPNNCLDKLFLLEAEYASIRGDHELAFQKYTCSNALAMDAKCLWVQALANERAGDHLLQSIGNHDMDLAHSFYRRARDVYQEWGAFAKVQRLNADLAATHNTEASL